MPSCRIEPVLTIILARIILLHQQHSVNPEVLQIRVFTISCQIYPKLYLLIGLIWTKLIPRFVTLTAACQNRTGVVRLMGKVKTAAPTWSKLYSPKLNWRECNFFLSPMHLTFFYLHTTYTIPFCCTYYLPHISILFIHMIGCGLPSSIDAWMLVDR